MTWILAGLLVLAGLLSGIGVWTRRVGRSADERAGADIPFLLAGLLLALDILLLAGWAVARLI